MKTLAQLLPLVAQQDIGLKESPLGSNRGPQIQKFFDADIYDPNGAKPGDDGYPWCAASVCYWLMIAMARWENDHKPSKLTFKRPTTPAAFGFEEWSLKQDNSTKLIRNPGSNVKAGDIVILSISHILIAATDADRTGHFETIEGNTSEAGSREGTTVMRKTRHISGVRSVVRLMV